jgi:hypothetical protein
MIIDVAGTEAVTRVSPSRDVVFRSAEGTTDRSTPVSGKLKLNAVAAARGTGRGNTWPLS